MGSGRRGSFAGCGYWFYFHIFICQFLIFLLDFVRTKYGMSEYSYFKKTAWQEIRRNITVHARTDTLILILSFLSEIQMSPLLISCDRRIHNDRTYKLYMSREMMVLHRASCIVTCPNHVVFLRLRVSRKGSC